MNAEEKTYTKKEIAEKLHVTTKTIDNYIKAGKLKAAKLVNSRVLITETAFNNFLEQYVKER